MDETPSYPPIEPTDFDLIVVGTGLPQSVIAAAASSAGKSVLHLDSNSFYGSHFSSLNLDEFSSFLTSQSAVHSSHPNPPSSVASDAAEYVALDLKTRPMYSDVEITSHSSDPLEHSRKFNLDVSGPRVLFCADAAVDLMLKSGASQYLEFKSIDASFVCDADGRFSTVPDSRAAIFKDRSLSLTEKNQLMRFFKLIQGHLAASDEAENDSNARISEDDLESPFVEFLNKMRLPPKIKSMILYALAMADYDQDSIEVCKDVLDTKIGIDRLALYHSSVGRFPNALGALIYPIYGQGELTQAFCRRAAVKGCIYVLRMPVIALLMEKESRHCKGVRLASGQDIFSQKLLVDPSFIVPVPVAPSQPDCMPESSQVINLVDAKQKVARGICIMKSSLKPDVSNFVFVYPPRSLYPEQVMAIRAVQIGSNLGVCPSGMFVLYLSTLCNDATQGKELLQAAIKSLFTLPVSGNPENSSSVHSENMEEVKPTLLWSALYTQDLVMGSFESISSTSMPDGNLNYNVLLDATVKLFHQMYPQEEFFPETTSPENFEDDDGLSLES